MKVLLLGGTGAMGTHVIDFLKKKDKIKIVVSSRSARKANDKVTYVQGNAKDITFLKELCKQHWDAILDFMVYTTSELLSRIDLLLSSTVQYLFFSSARVYADSSDLITEDSPRLLDVCTDQTYLSTDEYALAKAREENILFSHKNKNWTIIRPSLTYGENRLQLGVYEKENWLYRALHGRSIVFSKDLMERYYTLSYGKDVAEGIAALVGNKDAVGEVFHIVQDQSFQWKNILELYVAEIEKVTGKKPNVVLTEKSTNLKLEYKKYQVIYGRYFNRHFDNSKIKKFVDTSNWLQPDDGLVQCLDTFLKEPVYQNIDWNVEVLLDKAAHEFTPIKDIKGKRAKLSYLKHRFI